MDPRPGRIAAFAFMFLSSGAWALGDAHLAWRRDGDTRWVALDRSASQLPERVPLGSLWKVFVYAYLADTRASEPVYRCAAGVRAPGAEDEYCCEQGGSIGRDDALSRSCGRYFDPVRLGIDAVGWQQHWLAATGESAWLRDLGRLTPATELHPAEILAALDAVSLPARRQARSALLKVLLEGYGKEAWPALGTGFRFKTWSWHVAGHPDQRIGGGAGWLADGTPVWFGGAGTSHSVLRQEAAALAAALPPLDPARLDDTDAPCVNVEFFARYPIRQVTDARGKPLVGGILPGTVKVAFENGQTLAVPALQQLDLQHHSDRFTIQGSFSLEDYVARVIDREGHAEPAEAARALAVAARTYLIQNATRRAGCWAIADSSRTQRVSPAPPTPSARAAARFTEGLILDQQVHYHQTDAAIGTLAWTAAVERARAGARFDRLLEDAFPGAVAMGVDTGMDCERLGEAEIWITQRARLWDRELQRHPGFEKPATLSVCRLTHGQPYSDQRRNRIYVRDWLSWQARFTLAHEYIHLAFPFHPDGDNETFVENTARHLTEGTLP